MVASPQKNAFMLTEATVMVAPFGGTPVFDLIPATHSVGMAKEVNVSVESGSIDLTNGVAQALVESRKTNVNATISANIFEYTAQNMFYAQGLSTTATQIKRGKLASIAAAAAATLSVNSDPVPGDAASAITATGDIPSGATLIIQDKNNPDRVFVTKSSGAATGTGPYSIPIAGSFVLPAGLGFAVDDYVYVVNQVGIADISEDALVAVKVVGTLSSFARPVVALFPKVRITKGFNVTFTESEYGMMPWEMRPLLLSASEATGRLAEIGTRRPGALYIAA